MILEVGASFDNDAEIFETDPKLGPAQSAPGRIAAMGDIAGLGEGDAHLKVRAVGSAPIERIDIFNGLDHVETIRPYGADDLGRRIRVIWEGSADRGRARHVIWDGSATFEGNTIERAKPINFLNPDKTLDRVGDAGLQWRALTTGNYGGFDAWLGDGDTGTLVLDTPLVKESVPVSEIGFEDKHFEVGPIGRGVRMFRLPDENSTYEMTVERSISLKDEGDNPLYVRITQEDGNLAWSSPIYVFRP